MVKQLFNWFFGPHVSEPVYRAREVWMHAHIDPKTKRVTERPVLIFRKASNGMFWGLLLSSTRSHGRVVYVPRLKNGKKVSPLSQMRTLKAIRLTRRLGEASEKEFASLTHIVVRRLVETTPAFPIRPRRARKPQRLNRPLATPSPFLSLYTLQPR